MVLVRTSDTPVKVIKTKDGKVINIYSGVPLERLKRNLANAKRSTAGRWYSGKKSS